MVPAYATAGALIYVAVLMTGSLATIDWNDLTEAGPVLITAIMMPLSFSIANGIALGFIAYPLVKCLAGRTGESQHQYVGAGCIFYYKVYLFRNLIE